MLALGTRIGRYIDLKYGGEYGCDRAQLCREAAQERHHKDTRTQRKKSSNTKDISAEAE